MDGDPGVREKGVDAAKAAQPDVNGAAVASSQPKQEQLDASSYFKLYRCALMYSSSG